MATSISPRHEPEFSALNGWPGGAAATDRAVQARHLCKAVIAAFREYERMSAAKRRKAATRLCVMIHGAFCGPWSLDGLQAEIRGGRLCRHRARAALSRSGRRRPRRWARPAWPIMPPTWKKRSGRWAAAPILVGHSMGGLLAQMLAARMDVRAPDPAGAVGALGRAAHHPVRDRRRPGDASAARLLEHGAGAQPRRGAGPFARTSCPSTCATRSATAWCRNRAAPPSRS